MQVSRCTIIVTIIACIIVAGIIALWVVSSPHPVDLPFGSPAIHLTERFCLSPSDDGKVLTSFWKSVANRSGFDDSDMVLLRLSVTAYPGKNPRNAHFYFASEGNPQSEPRIIFLAADEGGGNCVRYATVVSPDRWEVSWKDSLHPSQVFSELEQIRFSDLGLGDRELFINTAIIGDSPDCSAQPCYLLENGTVVPLREIRSGPSTSLAYPWNIQVMHCTGGPGEEGCSSGGRILIFSDQRLEGVGIPRREGNDPTAPG